MACDSYRGKIDGYADGDLSPAEMRAVGDHLRECPSCTSDVLARVQWKRTMKSAGTRYSPSIEFKRRIEKTLPAQKTSETRSGWRWGWVPALSSIAALALLAVFFLIVFPSLQQKQTIAEIADLHNSTLASATPVDVVSTDKHTVKPWFQGKIPFTFNVPDLANTPFTLEGGRVAYLAQSAGAQLIFKTGNHHISVFIFQNRADLHAGTGESSSKRLTFNVETFSEDDLRYFIIGDTNAADIRALSDLLKSAARS
jgi:anti-sigma factor RsiW